MQRTKTLFFSAAVALLLPSCASRGPAPAGGEAELATRATLLMLADRREFQRLPLEAAIGGGPALREELATTLGWIGDPRGRELLAGLLRDPAPPVRRAAAFALGLLGRSEAVPDLLVAVTDPDAETGMLAVEALGKLGTPLAELQPRLAALGEPERSRRLLPALFRFREADAIAEARLGLARPGAELRWAAAYALARFPRPEAAPDLRRLLADPDPALRALAARGLGEVGSREDLASLLPLADEAAAGVAIPALRAAARLRAAGSGEAAGWAERLAARAADGHPGVRLAALEAAGAFLPDPGLERLLAARAGEASTRREREVALVALAGAASAEALAAATGAAGAEEPALRAAAAAALGRLGALGPPAALDALARDREPKVRVAALEARLAAAGAETEPLPAAAAALSDPDPAVRATALDWLVEHPEAELEALEAALGRSAGDEIEDAARSAVRALAARGRSEPRERGGAILALERAAADPRHLVRREAAAGLVALGAEAPAPRPVATGRSPAVYRQILVQTRAPRRVALEIGQGRLELELDCPRAPLTCLSFLQLANAGFFDGLTLHRVVPDFVVQGGDPRGDGWGGPGYTLRDEINRLRYGRGTVGMALAGADTGGSQFFVTLSPQPHLDGGYTAFGRVVEGDEILDRIVQGERILRAREIGAGAGSLQ
ncbi:MAG: peptidylprolyl isomerase [Thermoanaerobaculia bacterium]|nr:peptidylprolyl isomerase [Thermoanaerobaculia bacterium]